MTQHTVTEPAKNDFYGPALAEARYLESKCADYPQIVVANEAENLIQEEEGFSDNKIIEKSMAQIAALGCTVGVGCGDAVRLEYMARIIACRYVLSCGLRP
ncbi:MAG: hypothetical protein KAT58_12015 [candidate division Zixibacteria bacterium]|nr:hypothetical protein [candidate division Zixibacteria bacterium]